VEDRYCGKMTNIRLVHQEPFETTIDALKNSKSVLDKDLRKLDTFIDDIDVLRVGGRLVRSRLIDSLNHHIALHLLNLNIVTKRSKDCFQCCE